MSLALFALQNAALLAIVMVCICRINAMMPQVKVVLKGAYLLLATGAFTSLAHSSSHETSWHTALFSMGVALALVTDRRASECYSPAQDVA